MIIENYRTGCLDSGLCRYWRRHKRLKVINHEVEVKPESQGGGTSSRRERDCQPLPLDRERAKETIRNLILSAVSLQQFYF